MKKVVGFLRSMRFGMLLLACIAALSIVGTLVPQGQSAAYYEQAYEGMSGVLLLLGVDHMYSTWYYVAMFAMLCVNLSLCSLLRIGKIRNARAALLGRAEKAKPEEKLSADAVQGVLRKLGFKKAGQDLYIRRTLGLYGSFVTHLGMLLLVIASACVFTLEEKEDFYLMPGDIYALSDGCAIAVDGFSMENEKGQLDYISKLTMTEKSGAEHQATITVNNPARFANHTVYQQNYAFAAVLDLQTAPGAPAEQVVLDGPAFLSLDGVNGLHYMNVYGDYVEMEDGMIMPINSMGMNRPAYMTAVITEESQEMRVVLPGEEIEAGGVYFTFREPMAYPGLRVKTQPDWVLPLLYTSFAVLVAGLYLCFFHVPAAVCLRGGKVRAASTKESAELIEQLEERIDELSDKE